jgi:predicted phage terminase large subunit-like protein
VDTCKALEQSYYESDKRYPIFIIEDVSYQKALPQQLEEDGVRNVRTVRPGTTDKRSRLVLTASAIKSGKILFPKEGAEQLIQQIVHFGVEKHDDLADAFSNLAHSVTQDPPRVPRVYSVNWSDLTY